MQEIIWFMSDGCGEIDESVKVSEIWEKAKELLEKEKQQIIDARQDGYESTYNSCESGCMGKEILEGSNEKYYSETFNNKD